MILSDVMELSETRNQKINFDILLLFPRFKNRPNSYQGHEQGQHPKAWMPLWPAMP